MRLRIFGEALAQEGLIFSAPGGSLRRGGGPRPSFARGHRPVHSQEQLQHTFSPLLMHDLVEESELAQQMGVAQAVHAVEFEVGAPAIVDEPAGESRQEREVLDGVAATFAMHAVPARVKVVVASIMQPTAEYDCQPNVT